MAKKTKNIVQQTLKRFYTISVWDEKGNPVEWDQSIPILAAAEKEGWNYDYETDSCVSYDCWDITITQEIIDIYIENKNKYDKIKIVLSPDRDGYVQSPEMVGIRLETDEEFDVRIKKEREEEEEEKKAKQIRKEQREEKKKQKELALLKELQSRYTSPENNS